MNSRYKAFLPLAAIAMIGLAGSSAVFAQTRPPVEPGGPIATNGPVAPPFQCAQGETAFKDGNGTNDNLAVTGAEDPKPHPSAALSAAPQNLDPATNIYDQTASNYHFGDTFKLPSGTITKVRLTTRLKANSGDANNDAISFSGKQTFTPGHFSLSLNTLSPGWASSQGAKLFVIDFDNPGSVVHVNGPGNPFNPGAPYATFYADMNANHVLHVYVQDDTSVDYVQIEGCVKPPAPKYDLVATKKHDGNVYSLNVHNAGSQIMPIGRVEVVEIVPAGLTITSIGSAGWTCPVTLPVIGPDAFTCSYPIPASGIAPSAPLPPISLKTEGKAECPNCMRARLYLRSVSDGVKPVGEGDMKNNASCTM